MTDPKELRKIPKLDKLVALAREGLKAERALAAGPTPEALPEALSDGFLAEAAREVLEQLRQALLSGEAGQAPDEAEIAAAVLREAGRRLAPSLRRVINGTGILLHTNLGRAPLARPALAAIERTAAGYSNLEFDLEEGRRGSRYSHVEALLVRLTGAEAAMVVNNNAGGVLLALSALAKGRQVIISRGELVEIGGAFRVPEVMEQSGAVLKEVGATNKTRLSDYAGAIGPETAAILKVHPSNYRIVGFTQEVPLTELAALGRERGLAVIEDLGSGALIEMSRYGIQGEPWVKASAAAGADVITFSGDKLLGGPQAGIVVGRREYIEKIRRHPLNRALRIDKLSLAALEATLLLYLDESRAEEEVPFLAALKQTQSELRQKAERLLALAEEAAGGSLPEAPGALRFAVMPSESQVGGGSVPSQTLPSWALSVEWPGHGPDDIAGALRRGDPPVAGHISKDRFLLDLRSLQEAELPLVALRLGEMARPATGK